MIRLLLSLVLLLPSLAFAGNYPTSCVALAKASNAAYSHFDRACVYVHCRTVDQFIGPIEPVRICGHVRRPTQACEQLREASHAARYRAEVCENDVKAQCQYSCPEDDPYCCVPQVSSF